MHSLIGLPTTIRSLKRKGLRLEKGEILDRDYTGPVLEEVLKTNKVAHEVPTEGTYKGKHVVVAPIRSKDGKVIAALGIVDLLATIDLPAVFQEYTFVMEEVEECKKIKLINNEQFFRRYELKRSLLLEDLSLLISGTSSYTPPIKVPVSKP